MPRASQQNASGAIEQLCLRTYLACTDRSLQATGRGGIGSSQILPWPAAEEAGAAVAKRWARTKEQQGYSQRTVSVHKRRRSPVTQVPRPLHPLMHACSQPLWHLASPSASNLY